MLGYLHETQLDQHTCERGEPKTRKYHKIDHQTLTNKKMVATQQYDQLAMKKRQQSTPKKVI